MTEHVYLHYNRDMWAEFIKPTFPLSCIPGMSLVFCLLCCVGIKMACFYWDVAIFWKSKNKETKKWYIASQWVPQAKSIIQEVNLPAVNWK